MALYTFENAPLKTEGEHAQQQGLNAKSLRMQTCSPAILTGHRLKTSNFGIARSSMDWKGNHGSRSLSREMLIKINTV